MSSTNRGRARIENDAYYSPAWTVDRLLEKWDTSGVGMDWLEPSAGSGCIIDAVNKNLSPWWTAVEMDSKNQYALSKIVPTVYTMDFLDYNEKSHDVVFGNAPYKQAFAFVKHAFEIANSHVVFLMRTNFLASEKRAYWMKMHTPDIYMLPNRPSFNRDGTDSCEYCWCVWDVMRQPGVPGKVVILNTTSLAERRIC
jgi:hypothetical protein